jgi:hypothetical protein
MAHQRNVTLTYEGRPDTRTRGKGRGRVCITVKAAISMTNLGIPSSQRQSSHLLYNLQGYHHLINAFSLLFLFFLSRLCKLSTRPLSNRYRHIEEGN